MFQSTEVQMHKNTFIQKYLTTANKGRECLPYAPLLS